MRVCRAAGGSLSLFGSLSRQNINEKGETKGFLIS